MSDDSVQPSKPPLPRWRRWLRYGMWGALILLGGVLLLGSAVLIDGWKAIGTAPQGARLERMRGSAQWADGVFENPQALWNDPLGMFTEAIGAPGHGSPTQPLPVVAVDPAQFERPPASGLRVTWLGHSTLLLEIDGHRFLTDPVWGPTTAPVSWLGPERWYAPPLALADVPDVDAIILSHDHYDHLDYPSIVALADRDTRFIAPLGVGAHLEYWGVPAEHIVDVDWWDELEFGDVKLTVTPARHASGRQVFDQNRTLWAGYALVSPRHRVFFSGDTGLFPGLTEIGERLGPFDLTMLEVGAYGQAWPDWHLGPEQAVRAHQMLQGRTLLPIHWGLFNLAYHGWTEPIERVLVAADAQGVQVATPRPGESLEPTQGALGQAWWPDLPWRTAQQYPIVATKMDAG